MKALIVENSFYVVQSKDKQFISYKFLVTLTSKKSEVKVVAKELKQTDFSSNPHELIWYISIDHNHRVVNIPNDTTHTLKGSGMGRELLNLVIRHIKSDKYLANWRTGECAPDVNHYRVEKATLSSVDAYKENYLRRHKFYEKAGFAIEYSDDQGNGFISANKVSDLIAQETKPNILIEPATEALIRLLKNESALENLENQVELQNQRPEKEMESQDNGKRQAFIWGFGIGVFIVVLLYLAFNSFINK